MDIFPTKTYRYTSESIYYVWITFMMDALLKLHYSMSLQSWEEPDII